MKIAIVAVGRLKERYIREAADEYLKRLRPYASVNVVEVADEPIPQKPSEAEEAGVMRREGERILGALRQGTYVICLDMRANQLSSEEFSHLLDGLALKGRSDVTFIIGGSLGLAPDVLARADMRLSLSKMTFPHQVVRVILLEQIYRAFKISRGEMYHK